MNNLEAIRQYTDMLNQRDESLSGAYKKIKEREENFYKLYNAIDFVFILSETGDIIDVNESALTRLGYIEEEILEDNFYCVSPFDNGLVESLIKNIIVYGEMKSDIPLMSKNGSVYDVEFKFVRGTWGKLRVIFAIGRDVSEIRAAQHRIRMSEDKFSKAFMYSPISKSIVGLSTEQIMDVNLKFCERSGYSREELIGKTMSEMKFFEKGVVEEMLTILGDEGRVIDYYVEFNGKNGIKIPCFAYITTFDYNGERCVLTGAIALDTMEAYAKKSELKT